jgi:hypothetical protein
MGLSKCSVCGCDCRVGIDATREPITGEVTCDECNGDARCPRCLRMLADDGWCSSCHTYPIDDLSVL